MLGAPRLADAEVTSVDRVAPVTDAPHLMSTELVAGLHSAGYSTLSGGTQAFYGVQASLGALGPPVRLRVDALLGRFSGGTWAAEAAVRAYHQTSRYLLGASYGYTRLEGDLDGHMFSLHGEVYEERWLGVTSSFGLEKRNLDGDLAFGEILLRMYPADRVLLVSGVSYVSADIKQTRADVLMRAEWSPIAVGDFQWAFYGQYGGNLFTRVSLGVIVYCDRLPYVDRERREGLFGARFK